MKLRQLLATALLGLLSACSSVPRQPALTAPESPATATTAAAPEAATKHRAVPVEALNADVHQDNIEQTICVSGYTATVRPPTSYTNGVKLKLLKEQGLPASDAAEFELDHRVPLALGGNPRNLQNLMLQPWEGKDGAKVKDRLERRLQVLVCAGKLLLDDARRAIYFDWQGAYRTYVGAP